jgi:hypothetical protein
VSNEARNRDGSDAAWTSSSLQRTSLSGTSGFSLHTPRVRTARAFVRRDRA